MVLVIDNFDSFTYNLVQCLGTMGADLLVRRNNEVSPADVSELRPSHIVISPGPGRPDEAGATLDILKAVSPQTPVLGVCLGHQAIGLAFGGRGLVAVEGDDHAAQRRRRGEVFLHHLAAELGAQWRDIEAHGAFSPLCGRILPRLSLARQAF